MVVQNLALGLLFVANLPSETAVVGMARGITYVFMSSWQDPENAIVKKAQAGALDQETV